MIASLHRIECPVIGSVAALMLLVGGCGFEMIKAPEGVDADCQPLSCDDAGASCGLVSDRCGSLLDCGGCAVGEVCGSAGFDNVCCEPTSCDEQLAECGSMPDGCGGTLNCGECADGELCGGDGPNLCGDVACEPLTCEDMGLTCGSISDGCSGILDCGLCSGDEVCGGTGVPNLCGVPESTPAPTGLTDNCFDWPNTPFSTTNYTSVSLGLEGGDSAPDITLLDIGGQPHSLTSLLAVSPVLLITGSYTCPVFQRNIADTEQIASVFAGSLQVVVVVTPEAHPMGEASPYFGTPREREYSVYGLPTTYEERVAIADEIDVDDNILLLVDELAPHGANNPFWCTYGTAPNAAWLVGQTGEIIAAHRWFDARSMAGTIQSELGL